MSQEHILRVSDNGNAQDIAEQRVSDGSWAIAANDKDTHEKLDDLNDTLQNTVIDVNTQGRAQVTGLTFSQTLGALGSYQTSWVDVSGYEWLDLTAKLNSSSAVRATLEFTDASDPNTTPPGVDDVSRDLVVTLGGSALGGLDEPSFGIPAQMTWARITVTDLTGGQDIDISTFAQRAAASNALLPLATTLDKSFRAALTRSVLSGVAPDGSYADVPTDGTLSEYTSTSLGPLATGSAPSWDAVGPIVADNVIDTGWLEVDKWNYQSFHATFDCSGIKVFLLDAEDDQGNGSIYNTLQFAFPTATSRGAGTSIEIGAPFFNNYFRIVAFNDTGNVCNDWNIRSFSSASAPGPIFLSLDQPIFDFFPAPVIQSIIKGKQPDGDYEALPISGSDPGNTSSTPLGPDAVFEGAGFDTTGYLGGMIAIESDVASATDGVTIEFSEDENFSFVHRSLMLDYTPGVQFVRFFPVMQGEYYRVTYTNGPIPQSRFVLRAELLASAAQEVMLPLGGSVNSNTAATVTRSGIIAPDDSDEWGNITRSSAGALRVSINELEAEIPIEPKQVWGVRGANVGAGAAVKLPVPPINGVGTVSIQNEGAGTVYIAPSADDAVDASARRALFSQSSMEIDVNEGADFWAIADASGGATSSARLSGNTAGGGTNPTNALTSNDIYATISTADILGVSGFAGQDLLDTISSVIIGFEGKISSGSPATETVSFVDEKDASAGNVGSITSPTVTSNTDHLYIASISRRNGSAAVNSVSGLGLTWTKLTEITDDSNNARIDVWYADGTDATGDGTVQAVFSATATNCTMKVSRWSGVDLTTPIADSETLGVAGSSNSYSDSIAGGVDKGAAVTFVTSVRRTHTPGSGFTELTKVNTGNGPNDNRQSVSYLQLVADGPQAYSGTFSANADWVLIAVVLQPRPLDDPQITLGYKVDGVPGSSTSVIDVTDSSDLEYTLDISADRVWTQDDMTNLEVTLDGAAVTAATVEVDYVFVDQEESEGSVAQFVTLTVVGDS